MSCSCGHDHAPLVQTDPAGMPVPLPRPMVSLTRHLFCADATQLMTALTLLPDHVRLSREEPGCLRFDLWQDGDDPSIWHLIELFRDAEALEAQRARTQDSAWGRDGAAIGRDIHRREVMPVLRPETRHDLGPIDAVLSGAFGGTDEAGLVRRLRDDGDLALSLVADAAGTVLGHVALSPLQAEGPAVLMAPVAVATGAQGLGIGTALVRQALSWADPAAVVVVGHPSFYGPLGFRPARLASPYAGLSLQMIGDLAPGSAIRPAPAFVGI